jgi:pimeloyl-ACP methyl ester carboxylesterase
MPVYHRDGLSFHYRDAGSSLPFVFQHGLGGDSSQPCSVYRPAAGIRLLSIDFRAHGQTHPVGDPDRLTISNLADDLMGFLDHLRIDRAVIGGISLGAAVAVNVALRREDRVLGLVLSRPAWVDGPLPDNVRLYATIARLIRDLGPKEGLERFLTTSEFQAMESQSPDCARSLIGQFEQPRAEELVARLERLPGDRPCTHREEYGRIRFPTLILGNHQDPIHLWSVAETLARLIPGADFREITPKSVSLEFHAADVQRCVDAFLTTHFRESPTTC